ncbi:DNA-3-methyladenine glycosylase [Planktothrix pseudagardhii]|uniref:Putative 3-methyladenine DNA glycosylase n=1 Tax=Planktothrix pseudagardhii TaxID=132604 RepID=A0A9W4CY97_9CYAN|nr:DNA-3-methyladenine glycosylase [Planktothrix pseudagardhii]CAD5986551.1 Putative 3-methyladenine DNA glycosylase [Planktothrix pseudagardhii]
MNSTRTPLIVDPSELEYPSTQVAPQLLGCTLVRQLPNGEQIRGLIVETEAYGLNDPACHAYRRRTPRNAVMFGPAGVSYVYFIYGMYCCLNIVTDLEGVPSAVLIRALQVESLPISILAALEQTQPLTPKQKIRLASGPGKLCRLLQINTQFNGLPLHPDQGLWLEHPTSAFQQRLEQQPNAIIQTTRIGLSQGQELPWRWYLANCPSVSKL